MDQTFKSMNADLWYWLALQPARFFGSVLALLSMLNFSCAHLLNGIIEAVEPEEGEEKTNKKTHSS